MPPRRDPTRHRVHPHRRVTPSDQVAEEARHRRQPSSDRPCRQARLAITDADHGTVSTLMREELEHVGSHHVERRLVDDREECLQVMSDSAQRVRPTPPTDELQVAVDDGITQARNGSRPRAKRTGRQQGTDSSRHAPSHPPPARGCPQDHTCIRRSGHAAQPFRRRRSGRTVAAPGGASDAGSTRTRTVATTAGVSLGRRARRRHQYRCLLDRIAAP